MVRKRACGLVGDPCDRFSVGVIAVRRQQDEVHVFRWSQAAARLEADGVVSAVVVADLCK